MLVNVDFDVDLDVDSEVGLSHTRMRRLVHIMLTQTSIQGAPS